MGLNISVYRNAEFANVDCSNGGITSKFTQLNVVNVPEAFRTSTRLSTSYDS